MTDQRISETSPNSSKIPQLAAGQVIVSSRHPYVNDTPVRPGVRSTGGSGSSRSRTRQGTTINSPLHMQPGLQALLIAENQASSLIALARRKRNQLIRQANQESQTEIEAFRREREVQYQIKLHEATQLEAFQTKLLANQHDQLQNMAKSITEQRDSIVNYIIHHVIDEIHPKA